MNRIFRYLPFVLFIVGCSKSNQIPVVTPTPHSPSQPRPLPVPPPDPTPTPTPTPQPPIPVPLPIPIPKPTPIPTPIPNPTPIPKPIPPDPHPNPENPKSKIPDSGSGALTGLTAIFEAAQDLGSKNSFSIKILSSSLKGRVTNAKEVTKGKVNRLHELFGSGVCQTEVTRPSNPIDSSQGAAALFPRMKVKVSGLQCPIAMTLDMDVAADPADLKGLCKETVYVKVCKFIERANMNYQILDGKLSEELQVKNGEASMLFHIEQTYPWGVTSSPSASVAVNMAMSGQVDFTLKATDFKGQDHSIKGSQDFTVNMSLSGSSDHIKANQMVASVKESAQYLGENSKTVSNFSANLSVNGDQSQESYTIDGETVTADIYASERDKFANSMIAFGKKDNEGTHEPPDPIPSPVRQPGEIPPPPTDPPTKVKALQSQHGENKL